MGFQPSAYEIIIESACEVDNQLEVLVRSTKFLSVWPVCWALTDLPVVFRETELMLIVRGTPPGRLKRYGS